VTNLQKKYTPNVFNVPQFLSWPLWAILYKKHPPLQSLPDCWICIFSVSAAYTRDEVTGSPSEMGHNTNIKGSLRHAHNDECPESKTVK